MSPIEQSYSNHRLGFKPVYLLAGLLLFAGLAMFTWLAVREPSLARVAACALALGGLALWFSVRAADIRLQDRVIRAEMRARFERVFGAQRAAELDRLALKQVIALRFASDAELASLADQALAQPELSGDALKRQVRRWQADHLRV